MVILFFRLSSYVHYLTETILKEFFMVFKYKNGRDRLTFLVKEY